MKLSLFILLAVGLTAAQASWFGSDPDPKNPTPSQWTQDQFDRAQAVFSNLKADAFDTWDESRLREFLLEQGIVKPSGTREQLALLAKQKYSQYSSVATSFSRSATSLASEASLSASTALYGDSKYQASKSASSFIAQATQDISHKFDDSKDYVWSTWDDNRIRSYLEQKGIIKSKEQVARDQLFAKMRESYTGASDPAYQAWSDSYIRNWLISHGVLKSDAQKTRDQLVSDMNNYYYGIQDTAYGSWTDSQMRQWLIDHSVIKSEAQLQRDKLQKLLADNYAHAKDTIWGSWGDSDMRVRLVEHGYLKNDAQKTRDELVALMSDKYNDYTARTAPYLVWPDARLRAYLRENNISEDALPTSRPGLLQEVRIRWVQTSNRADAVFSKIRDVINGGVEAAEEKLGMILDMLTGHVESAKYRGQEAYEQGKDYANEKVSAGQDYVSGKYTEGKDFASQKAHEGKGYASQKASEGKDYVSSKTKSVKDTAGAKTAEFEKAGKKYWNEKVEEAKKHADKAKVEL